MLFRSIQHSLARLVQFSGRDSRSQFWLYVASVMGLAMVVWMGVMLRAIAATRQFALEHPDKSRIEAGPGHYSVSIQGRAPELVSPFLEAFDWLKVIAAVMILLLASAVVRRLHDSGRSGLWALLPIPFLAVGMVLIPRQVEQGLRGAEGDPGLFVLLFLNNLVYLLTVGLLIFLLAREGTTGPNRFGPPPMNEASQNS